MMEPIDPETDLALSVRQSLNETQMQFINRLGVGLLSLKRCEIEGTLPHSEAV